MDTTGSPAVRDILIVGAGAVGQVYGHHLSLGGARVSVFVKPAHSREAGAGYGLVQRRMLRASRVLRWTPSRALVHPAELSKTRWAQVWLCVPSDRLREPWLAALLQHIGGATVVSQHPAPADRQALLAHIESGQLVEGTISLLSWRVDLEGDGLGRDARFLLPPIGDRFSGSAPRVEAVVSALSAGGLSARVIPDAGARYRLMGAFFLPLMAALELSGWSIRGLLRGSHLRLACSAGQEASGLAAARGSRPGALARCLWHAPLLRIALSAAGVLAPLPLEAFLRHHFSKVGAQTRVVLTDYLARARQRGVRVPAIEELLGRLCEPD